MPASKSDGDLYAVSCPFCAIAEHYPSDTAVVPPSPFNPHSSLHPSTQLILSTPTVLAFLDTYPLVPGHVLVIPRRHHKQLTHLPQADASILGAWVPTIARAVLDATGATAFNVVGNNGSAAAQTVDHVHWHIIPRGIGWNEALPTPDEPTVESESQKKLRAVMEERGKGKTWIMFGRGERREIDETEAEHLASKIRACLKSEIGAGGLWNSIENGRVRQKL
jgi:diadenosine tetraphosphate (Ap4A) HIT family hydrolase